jgi:hypothetical protein
VERESRSGADQQSAPLLSSMYSSAAGLTTRQISATNPAARGEPGQAEQDRGDRPRASGASPRSAGAGRWSRAAPPPTAATASNIRHGTKTAPTDAAQGPKERYTRHSEHDSGNSRLAQDAPLPLECGAPRECNGGGNPHCDGRNAAVGPGPAVEVVVEALDLLVPRQRALALGRERRDLVLRVRQVDARDHEHGEHDDSARKPSLPVTHRQRAAFAGAP